MIQSTFPLRKIRSFVCRNGRMTDVQRDALAWLPRYELKRDHGLTDFSSHFQRHAPWIVEIGFGFGHSLLEMARTHPEQDFIGIEIHKPGIAALLAGIQAYQLTNLRLYQGDAVDIMEQCIADDALTGVQIFFPDPWPKRRHHKRRLIQEPFIRLILRKLKQGGVLHLATDWKDYAQHMMDVVTPIEAFDNLAGMKNYSDRSSCRPIMTKFERRGMRHGHVTWELQFKKR